MSLSAVRRPSPPVKDLEFPAPGGEKAVDGDGVVVSVQGHPGAVWKGLVRSRAARGPRRVLSVAKAADGEQVVPARTALLARAGSLSRSAPS
jgi:hypothetical protein